MTQNVPPLVDLVTNNWQASPLYEKIDEPTASDTDFITSGEDPFGDYFTVKLAPLEPPVPGDHKLTVRLRRRGSDDVTVVIDLLEGSSVVASKTVGPTGGVPTTSFADYELLLTQNEIDSIRSYADLSIRVTATGPPKTHERRTLDGDVVWSANAGAEVLYITKVGSAVYTADVGNTIRKWDAATGVEDTTGNWPVGGMPGRLQPSSDGSHLICHRDWMYQPSTDIPVIAKVSSNGVVVWESSGATNLFGVLPLAGKIYVIVSATVISYWVIDESDGSSVGVRAMFDWPVGRIRFPRTGTHYIATMREVSDDNLLVFGCITGFNNRYPGFIEIQKSDGTGVASMRSFDAQAPSTHAIHGDGSSFQITLASGLGGTGRLVRWAHNPTDDPDPIWSVNTGYGGLGVAKGPALFARPPRLYLQGDEAFVCGPRFNDFHLDGTDAYTCHGQGNTGQGDLLVKAFSVVDGSETRHWVV